MADPSTKKRITPEAARSRKTARARKAVETELFKSRAEATRQSLGFPREVFLRDRRTRSGRSGSIDVRSE